MSRLLNSLRLRRTLEASKSLNSNNRTLFNSCIRLDDNKDDENHSKNQNVVEEAAQTDHADKKTAAQKKLKVLLQLMTNDANNDKIPEVELPRPRVEAQKKYHKKKAEYLKRMEKIEGEKIGSKLGKAASEIAQKLGGDTKQTERELLEIYLGRTRQEPDTEVQESNLSGGEVKKTDNKLLESILNEEEDKTNIKDLLRSFEIEKPTPEKPSRAYQVRIYKRSDKTVHIPKMPLSRTRSRAEKVDLFGAEPLNIFTTDEEGKKGPPARSTIWEFLEARDIKLSVTHPPANIFEQLIQWTEQGKLWRFPINNEQDWEEQNVDFTEHVFLEHMLEPWCPSSGLIRQFMELVCVGLSKNPYLSVQEKHAHIIFYEHYFRQKNSLLIDLGLEPIKDRPPVEEQQEATAAA